jgi:hypothetical protein
MYAFLVALGAIIAAAGLALLASGVSVQQHAFDAANVTQAMIAVVGGCILIGLAFVVRALLRVERALMLRPMVRPPRSGESAESPVPIAQAGEPDGISSPPKPKKAPAPPSQPTAVAAEARPAPAQETAVEPGRAPALEQLVNAPVVEERDVSLLPTAPPRSDVENDDAHAGVTAKLNGSAYPKAAARPAVTGRPARRSQQQGKVSIFDSLWPKAQRRAPEVHPAPAVQAAPPPATPAQPADESVAPPVAQAAGAAEALPPATVSILKSGVVEGMAYTLYSDGSIEAQLPGGTLHFRSITELRNHIEKNG